MSLLRDTDEAPGLWMRIVLSFASLVAGNLVLYLLFWGMAYEGRARYVAQHPGVRDWNVTPDAGLMAVYFVVSVIGWILLGPATAVWLRPRFILRLNPLIGLVLGAILGPVSIVVLLTGLSLGKSQVPDLSFTDQGAGLLWILSLAIGAPTGLFYVLFVQQWARRRKLAE